MTGPDAPVASPSAPLVLEVDGLSVALPARADRRHAVHGVSLQVHAGETLCVVGESGSGKSVTAHAVMGLLPRALRITSGSIRLQGETLTTATTARLRQLRGSRMAMVFQEPMTALNPVMTCGAQVEEVLRLHTTLSAPQRRTRVLDILAETKLPDPRRIYGAFPHQISGGQRQRIMIAMAMVLEPALLIADEPTTALDVTTQAQILEMIAQLQARHGTAVLFITHDFGVVADIAHRVAVMRRGQVLEVGAAGAILRSPQDPYTRALIAAVPGMVPRALPRAAPAAPRLQVSGLTKTYADRGWFRRRRDVVAAQDVSFALAPGEILGVVGESGSGKSTIARCVALLTPMNGGRVILSGRDLGTLPHRALRDVRRRIQIVFQDPYRSLNPRRTVGQSIAEGPLNHGMAAAEAKALVRRLLADVQLDPAAADRYPHQFSGGQRQRICIARALALDPDVLICDEAVSALDVSVQAEILTVLTGIRDRRGLSILFITHDLRVTAEICDSLVVMQNGRIVESGPIAQVFAAPRADYTRRLLAAVPGAGLAALAPATGQVA